MTISIRRMSAGSGYHYLLRSVAAGDGSRALSTPLTRYYAEAGTPSGRWMGTGVGEFGSGQLRSGMLVTEEQLALLIGMGRDPITGDQLGRAYPEYQRLSDRIAERVAALEPDLTEEDRAAENTRIEAEESAAGGRHAVAGFDLTFSVPKSVSVLWGVADADVQERIAAAHHAAVADVVDLFEREVAATRAGFAYRDGAVAQVSVAGVAAVAYDHFDSRAGDPQLHSHVVIANRIRTMMDGRWRSLDGRPVFASRTGLSEHYNALLADRLAQEVGVEWERRERAADRNPRWEIVGVTDELIGEFSSRTREIELKKDELIAAYRDKHGRTPSARTIIELRAQATLATRPPKKARSLADLTADWRRRATTRLGRDATAWASTVIGELNMPLVAEDVPLAAVEAIAGDVVAVIGVKRATWGHWNLMAEATKQTMDLRFATTADREAVLGTVVDAAQARSVRLTPPELATSPVRFQREDGTSVFRPKHAERYSSRLILDAEARLLTRAENTSAPILRPTTLARGLAGPGALSLEQRQAVESVAGSGRVVDLLVGPAGAGKTTTMRALRAAWIREQGRGSVVGLAPSAAAAQVLGDDLEVGCENTAKWLHEYDHGRTELRPGQLVIIDEATLADTLTLDRITAIAARAGAKTLLVGDPHQLSSVDAGGAFKLLVHRRPEAPELVELHRFTHEWERAATLALRIGEVEVISTYARQHRLREGTTDEMLDAAYRAWRTDADAAIASILVTESTHAMRALNERARAERLLTEGAENGREIHLADGNRASVGDVVITRRNDRSLTTNTAATRWVNNGDRWRITDLRHDGSVVVERLDPRGRESTVLPVDYVAEHLDLGYAITAHRAQGVTVDTAHVVVTSSTTRENLYVSMTRGRDANIAYVALDQPDEAHTTPEPDDVTARTVLCGVLQRTGASLSAHETIVIEHEQNARIDRLAAELETIAADAQHDRFADLLRRSGLTPVQHAAAVASSAFGPLTVVLRRAEAYHHDLEDLVPRIVGQHSLDDADDIAAVLRHRVDHAAATMPRGCRLRPRLIAGLIPAPIGPMTADDRQAIDERQELIEARAAALAEHALESGATWVRKLGAPPTDQRDLAAWRDDVSTVAAYRDRYAVTSDLPTGSRTRNETQADERRRALRAVRRAATRTAQSNGDPLAPTVAYRPVGLPQTASAAVCPQDAKSDDY
ncbi:MULTISPECIES: MobF family relaxase [unclassified Nocardioides]|uniref:MobF family relaxase n=1 Tax=unclassified Nocardioides TaxID=2615069 RepID=UPI0009E9EDAF|nr:MULTISPECIES: MobF family relaxase [unclassified Nocardioides]